ncbi:hypothetical protein PGT21_001692 [Puccinia graminis f. sp. tritici]|uniref:Uncharacterized protein n=1 Tax=Puccinia graminis f. sp. tritici TaxID=56615 RepID=A0A5B0P5Z5_PUCGR|nr:hypothetical protein PGT21_001692 [Puccinia graminis f. sp. tritici]
MQPPDHILSLGAADRSAAPRPYPQPGGCRSFCSPQTISSAWGLQIVLQPPPPPPAHQVPPLPHVESRDSTWANSKSTITNQQQQLQLLLSKMVNAYGCEFCREHGMERTCEIIPLSGNCQRCQEYRVRCSFQSRTTLIETLYQNIMELRTKLSLKE